MDQDPSESCLPPEALAVPDQSSAVHRVRSKRNLTGGGLVLEVDGRIPPTMPGQFYMLRTPDRWPVLMPRPLSIYDRAPDGSWGSFLLKPIGPGTKALCDLEAGHGVVVTGPLGQPFPEDQGDPICVAGGVGLAPFLLLARRWLELGREPLPVIFGGRTKELLSGIEDFEDCATVHAATNDGSFGFHGLVTELLGALLDDGSLSKDRPVFCCGPDPMMVAVARMCAERGIGCWLSLENVMACGYGVCNGCSVHVQGERFKDWPYSRSCQDGPVYRADDLVLDKLLAH